MTNKYISRYISINKLLIIIQYFVLVTISMIFSLVVINTLLEISHYKPRPHSWIFSNEEFIQNGNYKNFFTLDHNEIYKPEKNTSVETDYWETDEFGFRLNPNHNNQNIQQSILVLGDSFAYGHGVRHTDAWSALLEKNLQSDGKSVIVHNAGVPATGTDQQYVRFKRLVSEIKPVKVIWMLNINDPYESNSACLFKENKDGNYSRIPVFMNIAYINAFTIKHLPKSFVRSKIGNLLTTLTVEGKDLYTFGCTIAGTNANEKIESSYFKKLEYLLHQAKLDAQKHNIDIIFLLAPSQVFFDHKLDNNIHEIKLIKEFNLTFNRSDIKSIDLNEKIAAELDPALYSMRKKDGLFTSGIQNKIPGATEQYDYNNDNQLNYNLYIDEHLFSPYSEWHLNEKGNEIVAEIIFKSLSW